MSLNIHRRLRETGKLLPGRRVRDPQRLDRILNIEEDVLDAVYENPSISIRRLSGRFDVPPWIIWKTLHEQLLYPYHVQKVQALRPTDFAPRRTFCEWFCGKCRNDPAFASRILVTDESCFTRAAVIYLAYWKTYLYNCEEIFGLCMRELLLVFHLEYGTI
ncbi:hypothetical protein BDFB_008889, partial [Asbolus verrucosus]